MGMSVLGSRAYKHGRRHYRKPINHEEVMETGERVRETFTSASPGDSEARLGSSFSLTVHGAPADWTNQNLIYRLESALCTR